MGVRASLLGYASSVDLRLVPREAIVILEGVESEHRERVARLCVEQ